MHLLSCLCILVALALSSAAPTDQIPLSRSTKIFRTVNHQQKSHVVGVPPSVERFSKSRVGHDHGVEVKYFTFDDAWFENGPNQTYEADFEGYLNFNHFNVFSGSWAEEEGFLDYRDLDCAASKPSALYNAPNEFGAHTQSVIRSNATALAEAGLSEFFDVIAWSWKPLGPGSTDDQPVLSMDTWRVDPDSKTSEKATYVDGVFVVWFQDNDGYYDPDTMIPELYFGPWGKNVNWIEVDTKPWGESGRRFDFCLDNLVVLFHDKENEDLREPA